MFEKVLPKKSKALLTKIRPFLQKYQVYLAGGTGLALQLGHRISIDFDFFSANTFDSRQLAENLRISASSWEENLVSDNTLSVRMDKIGVSIFYYNVRLVYPTIRFDDIPVADWRDIIAEKIKVISQRGSKKDFYDLYTVFKSQKFTIEQAVNVFDKRFRNTGINYYHVLKSITYFEDADKDPEPKMFTRTKWPVVKKFFITNIKQFEKLNHF